MQFIPFCAIALVVLSSPAYAYLDPGTGSMLFQTVLLAFLGVGVFFRNFFGQIFISRPATWIRKRLGK